MNYTKRKITEAGQACRKCGTPVELRQHRPGHVSNKAYWFEWWLRCPRCKTIYFTEEAKRFSEAVTAPTPTLFDDNQPPWWTASDDDAPPFRCNTCCEVRG